MGDAYRGLTIRIGADARPLQSAISSIKYATRDAQQSLNRLTKALKFDPSNAKLMEKSMERMGDKAKLSATEMKTLSRAVEQAANKQIKLQATGRQFSGTIAEAAGKFKDIYSETERVKSQIRGTDEQLETVYDKLKQIVAKEKNLSDGDADKYVKKLQRSLIAGGEAARKARNEVERLMTLGFSRKAAGGQGLKMILGYSAGDLEGLKRGWWNLHVASSQYHADQKELKKIAGFSRAKSDIEAVRSELRALSADYARTAIQFKSSNIGQTFEKATRQAKLLDASIERAHEHTERATAAARELPHSFEAAQAKMRAIRTEAATIEERLKLAKTRLKEIESTSGFDKAEASSEKVYANLAKTEHEISEIKFRLSEAQAKANALADDFKQAKMHGTATKDELKKMASEWTRATAKVAQYTAQLKSAESRGEKLGLAAGARDARAEVRKLEADLARVRDMSTHSRFFGQMAQSIRTAGYGLYSTVTPAIMMAGRAIVRSAEEVDSSYRNMRKTVNGTEEDFEHLLNSAIEMSRTRITSASQILEIEAMGGQLGIAVENLEAFATTVSNLDIATNMEADDISEQLGKMASVMDIDVSEYDKFGDALVRLGNNMPVLEGDIMNLTMRYMGMGKVVGMQSYEMLGWAAAASATGQKAEAAGSSMQRFISNMESAVNGAEDDLYMWAQVAGMSSEEFKHAFETNASGAMYSFIKGLGEMQRNGESVNQMLKKLGINNVRDKQLLEGLANQMANGTDEANLLKEALDMSSEAYHGMSSVMQDGSIEEAGDAAREAARKSEGFSGTLGILKNNAIAAALELGDGLVPIMQTATEGFQSFTEWLASIPDETKTAISSFALFAASLGPMMVGFGAVGDGLSKMFKMVSKFPTAWAAVSLGTRAADVIAGSFGTVGGVFRSLVGDSSRVARSIDNVGERMAVAASSAGAFKLAMGGLGVAVAIAAIGALISEYQKYQEHAEKAARLSETSYDRIAKAAEKAGDAVAKAQGDAVRIVGWEETKKQYYDFVEELAASYDTLQQKADETFSNNAIIDHYAESIEQVLEAMDKNPSGLLSAEEQAKLAAAVEGYNKATGESIQITDAEKGKLKDTEGQAIKTADAFKKLADNKKFAALQDYYNEEFTNAYKGQAELAQQIADTKASIASAEKALDSLDPSKYADWDTYAAEVSRYNQQISDGKTKLGEMQSQYRSLQTEVDRSTEMMELEQLAQSKNATEIDKMLASTPELTAAIHGNSESVLGFANALDSIGEPAQKLHPEQVTELASRWNGTMESILPLLTHYGVELDELNKVKINNQEFYLTDNGTIYDTEGKLRKFDTIEIGDKTYYVGSKGGVYTETAQLKNLKGIKLGDKTYVVSNNGTIDGEQAQLQGIKSVQVGNKTYYVTNDGSIYNELGLVGELNSAKIATKFVQTDDGGTAEKVRKKIVELDKTNPSAKKISVSTNAASVAQSAQNSMNGVKNVERTITITTVHKGKSASGALTSGTIAPLNAAGGLIPAHASGGINGIVNRPTLTNIGWVGEDGWEAVLHMRNAGGAVIPLSNHKYVRPFAQAVAYEMGGVGGSSSVTNNVTVQLQYDSSSEAKQIARDITNELHAILAMGA